VFENKILRKLFGPYRKQITREWGRLHDKELNDLYSSCNIVRVIKSRRIRWEGHEASMWEERDIPRIEVLVGNPEGK
jgi:hypothetical protein